MSKIKQKVYFLHIPKTAGTSTYYSLDKHFNNKHFFPYLRWDFLFSKFSGAKAIKEITKPKYKYFRGHFGYNKLMCQNKFVFTMLRDPITRTISQYRHIKRDPFNIGWVCDNFLKHKNETLSELLSDKDRASIITNVQTRYLSAPYDPTKDNTANKNFLFDSQPEFVNFTVQNPKKALLIATYRLIKMDFFGLQEYFEESLLMLSDKLNVQITPIEEKIFMDKKISSTSDVDQTTLHLLEQTNNLDLKLYFVAKKVFIKRFLKFIYQKTNQKINIYHYLSNREYYLNILKQS